MRILPILLLLSSALAVPRFAMMEDVTCSSCHSYQGGGGLRNTYGQDYVQESLVVKDIRLPWSLGESESPLYFGADMRYQAISDDTLRHFPMQFAVYSGAEFGNVIAQVQVSRILEEFRLSGGVRYDIFPLNSWIFLGKQLPAAGWRLDDHTSFTRGGNLSYLGLSYEGMPYTPYLEMPLLIEMGYLSPFGMEFSFAGGTPFIDPTSDSTQFFGMVKMDHSLYLGSSVARAGTAFLLEGEIRSLTASYGLSYDRFVYLGEYTEMHNWPETDMISVASLNQFSYRIRRGVDILLRCEFFDPDRKFGAGAITRLSGGVEIFPIPGIEIKLSYREERVELPDQLDRSQGKLLAQLHLFL
ncbi:MAG: hypothetical protein K9M49_02670 [Candidatus Marinimicrobia bacterium]|nr:hypothetical protein [Candidatus Neomarinimicrobiota bacterium]MCF7851067.1 hypothetical protein [Candidatus Neomarinimicrobiota bacterium]MCF7904037.1 hypothetical protein [Candidatus Neomarinimicrobiota bacterium]